MERKPLAFKLMVDPKNVRRAVALVTGEPMTDEELNKKFFDREPIELESPGDAGEDFQMTVAFAALMMAEDMKSEEVPEPMGKFAEKMKEMMDQSKKNGLN